MPDNKLGIDLSNENPDLLPIPESERKGRTIDNLWVWIGANMAVTTWAVGALPIVLGLSLKDAIKVILLGNLFGGLLFSLVVVMGHKTGVPQMALCRAPFGRRGANLAALMQFVLCAGWLGVNSYFSVSAITKVLAVIGLNPSIPLQMFIALLTFVVQVGIGVFGYYAIKDFDKYLSPIMGLLALIMTVLAFRQGINWDFPGNAGGLGRGAALAIAMGAIGIGWPISWTTWASDYSRYVPSSAPVKQTFWWGFAGMFFPASWLAVLGAVIAASFGTSAEASEMVTKLFPSFSIPALLLIFFGVVTTNVINVNSGALAALTMGIKMSRVKVGMILGIFGFAVTATALFISDIATVLDQWMLTLIVWMAPWVAVVVVDYYLVRRQQIHVWELFKPSKASQYGDVNWRGVGSWLTGVVVGNLFASTPLFTGPLAKAVGGGDYSWIAGFLVAGILHYLLEPKPLSYDKSVNTTTH